MGYDDKEKEKEIRGSRGAFFGTCTKGNGLHRVLGNGGVVFVYPGWSVGWGLLWPELERYFQPGGWRCDWE